MFKPPTIAHTEYETPIRFLRKCSLNSKSAMLFQKLFSWWLEQFQELCWFVSYILPFWLCVLIDIVLNNQNYLVVSYPLTFLHRNYPTTTTLQPSQIYFLKLRIINYKLLQIDSLLFLLVSCSGATRRWDLETSILWNQCLKWKFFWTHTFLNMFTYVFMQITFS